MQGECHLLAPLSYRELFVKSLRTVQEKPVEIIAPNSNYFQEKSELTEVDEEPVDKEKEIDDIGTKSEFEGNHSKYCLYCLSLRY